MLAFHTVSHPMLAFHTVSHSMLAFHTVSHSMLAFHTVSGEAHRVMSLRNPLQKMSKSDNVEMGRINISDSPDVIRKKIRKAVTDSTSAITYDPINRPGISNLVSIYSAVTGASPDTICDRFKNKESVDMKDCLADLIIEDLRTVQEKLAHLENEAGYVDDVLKRGAERASEKAAKTMLELRTLLGLC